MSFLSLQNLIDNTRTDKNTTHSYLEIYEKLFSSKRLTAKNILEIGIQDGGSIKLWYDYFINSNVYGLDIRKIKDVWPELLNNERIKIGCFDAYSEEFINNQLPHLSIKFDIMIDDGPHTLESMKSFINGYIPFLENKGILIIEDVQNIEWINELTQIIPENLKNFIEVYDLRHIKNRYDDILFVINTNI
jgi:hypothetical protein